MRPQFGSLPAIGGFHQRRIRNRARNFACLFVRLETDRANHDQLARAFAIRRNLLRPGFPAPRSRLPADFCRPYRRLHSSAIRQQRHRVVGGHVAIHGQRVIGAFRCRRQHFPQALCRDQSHRSSQSQRRRHVRMNHARALGHAGDAHRAALATATSSEATFMRVSVVMMALATASKPSGDKCRHQFRNGLVSSFGSSSTPITPVEAGKTYSRLRLQRLRSGFAGMPAQPGRRCAWRSWRCPR